MMIVLRSARLSFARFLRRAFASFAFFNDPWFEGGYVIASIRSVPKSGYV